ncbi:MAG: Gfo/Idh/MocA family oxidoreductase [Candidatus Omnitrophica bacterium]|nr:Gfo/Idh/MocA family oxidoreductase [Candidatus Omnitrophota bacterium]MCA9435542.1 Gfo/Idh/MocA family oxidoreductase [Candidatus Omnitrophota bacterium]
MAATKQVRVGIAGIGFMGVTHYGAFGKIPGAKVVAIADNDPKKQAGDWTGIRGNFGSGGGKVDLTNTKVFESYQEMAKDPDIDLIDLCLPTPLHKKAAVHCLKAGKHVLVEKPIALNLEDASSMIKASKKSGSHLFVGHVLRFFPEYRFLKKVYDEGKYGKLLAAHFRRMIAKPNWSGGENWFSDPKKTGGATLDLHIHDADFILHLLGEPKSVESRGVPAGHGMFDYLTNQYHYGKKGPIVSCEGGWIATAALPFEQSYEVYFEEASIFFNSSTQPVTIYKPDGKKEKARLPKEDGFYAELKAIIDPLKKGEEPQDLLGTSARRSLALCLAEQKSAKTGKPVKLG